MTERQTTLLSSLLASLLALCGCGKAAAPPNAGADERKLVEEMRVGGFDPEGEPVIQKWSDGSLSIHFEAMPPFFAEENGTEAEFEDFRARLEKAVGAAVQQDDREVFLIQNPRPDTAQKAKTWLESFHKAGK